MKTYQKILLSIMFTSLIVSFFSLFYFFPFLNNLLPILIILVIAYAIYKFLDDEFK